MVEAYNSVASWGRMQSIVGLIFALLIGGLFMVVGSMILFARDQHSVEVSAVVLSSDCVENDCKTLVSFVDEGQNTIRTSLYMSEPHGEGEPVTIYYDPSHPVRVTESKASMMSGILFLVGGILVVGLSSFFTYLTIKHKQRVA